MTATPPCCRTPRRTAGLMLFLGMLSLVALVPSVQANKTDAGAGGLGRAAALAKTVLVQRDAYGVPHVYSPTDAGCVFGFVYAQAEDYFWQIEDSYIRSLGRASEVYGESELGNDLVNRALEITKLSKQEWENAPPKSKELAIALCDALNFYLANNPQVKPRLITQFEPWHTMAFRRYMLYQSFIYRGSGVGPKDILEVVQEVKNGNVGSIQVAEQTRALLAAREADQDDMANHVGSNMWAVRPEKSASKQALMFINPHQPFFGPGQWYEGHLVSDEGWNLLGACFFGSPCPTIGYNGHIAWSHTVNQPDIVDLFAITLEGADGKKYKFGDGSRDLVEWTDVVVVREKDGSRCAPRQFKFQKTHQGPLVAKREGKPVAIRLAKLDQGGAMEEWYAMGKAKSVAEFKEAMKPCNIPMFNAMVADTQGNIFYVYNGSIPKRNPKFDWNGKPVDGSNPETDWQGYHTFAELPQVENPKCGYLQNCNQSPWTTMAFGKELKPGEVDENPKAENFPKYFSRERERDNGRARISRRILQNQSQFSFDDWTRAGMDTRIIEAETRIPELLKEFDEIAAKDPARAEKLKEAVALLKEWNCVSTVDSVPMTLFALTFDKLMQAVQKREMTALANQPRVRALEATLAELEKTFGTWKVAWGEMNRLQRIHGSQITMEGVGQFKDDQPSLPVAGAPGPLGVVFNFYTRPAPNQKRRYGVAGSSYVGVVELGPQVKARTILQFGQSSDPQSPHYFDQGQLFAKGEFKPSWYIKADVETNSRTKAYHPGDNGHGGNGK